MPAACSSAASSSPKPQGALTTTSGAAARASSQVMRWDLSPTRPSAGTPPACSTISGIQWPGANGRVRPLEHQHAWSWPTAECHLDALQTCPQSGHQGSCLGSVRSALAQQQDRRPDLVEGVRVDRQHVGPAAEVGQRVVDRRHVDRADGAEVLGHHQVGVEGGERVRLQVVEVLTGSDRRGDEVVDLARRQALGHRGGGDDPAVTGLVRGVALEGHPDHVVAGSDREQDLGGGGEQRHDPHEADPSRGSGRISAAPRPSRRPWTAPGRRPSPG